MNGLRNGSSRYGGMVSDYAEVVATQAFKKAMRQQNSPGGGYGSGGAGGTAGSQYHQQLENFKALFAVKEFMEVVVVVGIIMRKSSWRRRSISRRSCSHDPHSCTQAAIASS
ncbi:unnamed protein product [Sphagnum balticum]